MKHSTKITLLLLTIFLVSQFIGLAVVGQYVDPVLSEEQGETVFQEPSFVERPDIEPQTAYLPLIIILLIGTGILLLLIKFKAFKIWRAWFLLAVVISITLAMDAFLPALISLAIGIIVGIWKIFKPNPIIHNLSEPFIYAGLAALFVPIFNLNSIVILLILISLYDMYAVWRSKHMVTLAKAQSQANIFAGLSLPYSVSKEGKSKILFSTKQETITNKTVAKITKSKSKKTPPKAKREKAELRSAILGGGDISFPLFFAGVVFKEFGMIPALIIPLFTTAGLAALLFTSQEKKFYPAMPPLAIACFIGLGFVWAIGLV